MENCSKNCSWPSEDCQGGWIFKINKCNACTNINWDINDLTLSRHRERTCCRSGGNTNRPLNKRKVYLRNWVCLFETLSCTLCRQTLSNWSFWAHGRSLRCGSLSSRTISCSKEHVWLPGRSKYVCTSIICKNRFKFCFYMVNCTQINSLIWSFFIMIIVIIWSWKLYAILKKGNRRSHADIMKEFASSFAPTSENFSGFLEGKLTLRHPKLISHHSPSPTTFTARNIDNKSSMK